MVILEPSVFWLGEHPSLVLGPVCAVGMGQTVLSVLKGKDIAQRIKRLPYQTLGSQLTGLQDF